MVPQQATEQNGGVNDAGSSLGASGTGADPSPEELDEHRSTWLAFLGGLDDRVAAEMAEFHLRPDTPVGTTFRRDVPYAGEPDPARRMFLFARADPGERRPGVLFVHGGGWVEGHASMHMRHAHGLAALGYVTASIEYRLHPPASMDDELDDVRSALTWLRAHHGELGLDPGRMAVAGGSAGGHLAALVALGGGGGSEPSGVAAAVLWYPVTDLDTGCAPELHDVAARVCGGVERRRAYSPVHRIHAAAPPILSITGDEDEVTTLPMVEAFHRALDEAGVRNELVVVPGRGHAFDFAPAEWQAPFDAMVAFLAEVLPAT